MQSIIEWVSVDKSLPEPGERVLFAAGGFTGKDGFIGEGFIDNIGIWYRINVNYELKSLFGEVNYWAKMPELKGVE